MTKTVCPECREVCAAHVDVRWANFGREFAEAIRSLPVHPQAGTPTYGDLVDRLLGKYVIPVNDGAGLLDGKSTFTRHFNAPPIQRDAADAIKSLEHQVNALQAKLRKIVEAADGNPFMALGHYVEHVAPELRKVKEPSHE